MNELEDGHQEVRKVKNKKLTQSMLFFTPFKSASNDAHRKACLDTRKFKTCAPKNPFPLSEIRDLLKMRFLPNTPCSNELHRHGMFASKRWAPTCSYASYRLTPSHQPIGSPFFHPDPAWFSFIRKSGSSQNFRCQPTRSPLPSLCWRVIVRDK
jgi:hypothetical protein